MCKGTQLLSLFVHCGQFDDMANHSESLVQRGISAVVLHSGKIESVGKVDKSGSGDEESPELEYELLAGCETVKKVQNGEFNVVFTHPEAIVVSKEGRALLQNKFFQSKVVACIVDEAHCIEISGEYINNRSLRTELSWGLVCIRFCNLARGLLYELRQLFLMLFAGKRHFAPWRFWRGIFRKDAFFRWLRRQLLASLHCYIAKSCLNL